MTNKEIMQQAFDYITYGLNNNDDKIDLILRLLYNIEDKQGYNDKNISNAINELQKYYNNNNDYLPF